MTNNLELLYNQKLDLKEAQGVTDKQLERKKLIDDSIIKIKKEIDRKYSLLKIESLNSQEKREELEVIVRNIVTPNKEFSTEEKERIIQAIVGFGIVESILKIDPTATDIRFNGTQVTIENPEKKYLYPYPVDEKDIKALISRYANYSGGKFNKNNPNLPVQIGNIRVDAIHDSNAPYGTILSLRISRKVMVYSKDYFEIAPESVRKLIMTFTASHFKIFIGGEVGSSKTELQKYIIEPIPFEETILLIEEIPETHLKELYPDKDISSTAAQGGVMTIADLLNASKRHNASWILLTEVRTKEAEALVQLIKSGHKVICTFHSSSVYMFASTVTGMIAEQKQINEESYVRQIHENLDIGIHMIKRVINGKTYRWIHQVCTYNSEGVQMIFSQRLNADGELIPTYYEIPKDLREKICDFGKEKDILDFERECREYHEKRGD